MFQRYCNKHVFIVIRLVLLHLLIMTSCSSVSLLLICEGVRVVPQSLLTNRAACLCTIFNLFRRSELPSPAETYSWTWSIVPWNLSEMIWYSVAETPWFDSFSLWWNQHWWINVSRCLASFILSSFWLRIKYTASVGFNLLHLEGWNSIDHSFYRHISE